MGWVTKKDETHDWAQDPTKLTGDAIRSVEDKLDIVISGKIAQLQTQIDAGQRAALKFEADLQRMPTAVTTEVGHLKELLEEQTQALRTLMLEKFSNINGGFEQRDKALVAALAAAEKAVAAQTMSADRAATKAEGNFSELIKKQGDLFSIADTNTKERLTKLESVPIGSQHAVATMIAVAAVVATLAAAMVTIIGTFVAHSASVVTVAK
jgi:hypothetical protein